MSYVFETLGVAIVFGWLLAALLRRVIAARLATLAGVAGGLVLAGLAGTIREIGLIASLVHPAGLMLPAVLALRLLDPFKSLRRTWPLWETALVLGLGVAYLAASMGAVAFDPYRLGYYPGPVGVIALALVVWGWWRGDLLIAAVAVIGQLLWITNIAGENYLDLVFHAVVIPALAIRLLAQLVSHAAERLWTASDG